MFGANAIWGVMSPIAKFVMISGTITPWVVTNLRIAGAMILFWLVSLFMKPEHVGLKIWQSSSEPRCLRSYSTRAVSLPVWE